MLQPCGFTGRFAGRTRLSRTRGVRVEVVTELDSVDAPISIGRRLRRPARPPSPTGWRSCTCGSTVPSVATRWADIDRRSSELAAALADRGLGFGDRLGIGLRNSPQFVFSVFAAWKLGAVPVPMRWDLPEWELTRLQEAIAGTVHLGEDDVAWIDATVGRDVPDLPDVISPQSNGICSSGSTGLPKVIVSNRPGVYDTVMTTPFAESWGLKIPRPQTVIVLGPMYHVNGFHGLYSLLGGDRLVVMEKFDAARVVDVIERYRVSTFNCTPTMLKRMADLPGIEQRDLSSIEWFSQGAAPMPPYLVRRWAELIGPQKVIMAYGMSEGLGITAIRADEWMDRQGSVGRPVRDTEVRVLDPDGTGPSTGRDRRDLPAFRRLRRVDLPRRRVADTDDGGRLLLGGRRRVPRRRRLPIPRRPAGGPDHHRRGQRVPRRGRDRPDGASEGRRRRRDRPAGRRVGSSGARDHPARRPADPPTFEDIRAYAKARLHPYKVPKTIEVLRDPPQRCHQGQPRRPGRCRRGG